jgi:hypothetical protein
VPRPLISTMEPLPNLTDPRTLKLILVNAVQAPLMWLVALVSSIHRQWSLSLLSLIYAKT